MIIPLLLLLTFAIIDFSTVLYIYLTLENGVSQATRYAVTGQQMNDPNNAGTETLTRGLCKSCHARSDSDTFNR